MCSLPKYFVRQQSTTLWKHLERFSHLKICFLNPKCWNNGNKYQRSINLYHNRISLQFILMISYVVQLSTPMCKIIHWLTNLNCKVLFHIQMETVWLNFSCTCKSIIIFWTLCLIFFIGWCITFYSSDLSEVLATSALPYRHEFKH